MGAIHTTSSEFDRVLPGADWINCAMRHRLEQDPPDVLEKVSDAELVGRFARADDEEGPGKDVDLEAELPRGEQHDAQHHQGGT